MPDVRVGSLRYPVVLCRREQQPDPNSSGSVDVLANQRPAMAAIEPVGTITYLNGVQLGQEITHRITMRWRSDINVDDIIVHAPQLSNASTRSEVYKIRRWMDKDGRKRFVQIDAVIERQDVQP